MKSRVLPKKGACTLLVFLAIVFIDGMNTHPGAAEIHSARTMSGEKGTDQICLQCVNPALSLTPHSPAYERGEGLIID